MHKGPRAVRPTPGQRCAEWSQTDARTKLWVRRTKTWQTQLKRTSNRSVSWACPNMQKQDPSAKGQQETQVFAWFSAAWSSSMPFSRWFAGVDTIPGKPLRTQELSTKHVHVSSNMYSYVSSCLSLPSILSHAFKKTICAIKHWESYPSASALWAASPTPHLRA